MTSSDKKMIILVIAISLVGYVIINMTNLNSTSQNVVIKQEDKILKTISINKEEIYEFNFEDNVGFVEVKNNRIRMLPMEENICPKGICSDTGWINKRYETIVCLPNKLIVEFVEDINDDIDGIAF